jgi:PAS domain S-box-containing protein
VSERLARGPHALSLEDLEWLAATAYRIGEATTLVDLAQRCEGLLASFSEIERDGLYLYDFTEADGPLRLLYARGFTEEERQIAEQTAPERHPGWVVRHNQELWVPDTLLAGADSPSKDSPRGSVMRSRFWLPIAKDGEVYGAFGFASSLPDAFDERDRTNLRFVVELCSMAYRRLRADHLSRQAQEQAREAEERAAQLKFASLLALVADPVIALREDGILVYWNRGAELLLGAPASELVGQPMERILPERVHATHRAGLASLRSDPSPATLAATFEVEVLDARGEEIPVELRMSRVEERGQVLFIAVLRDLRERRRAEAEQAELRRLEARQAAISQAIPDLLFTVTVDGRLESVGASAQHPDLLVPAEEIASQRVQDLFDPALSARLLDAVRAAVTTGEVQTVEYDLEVQGRHAWFLARLARLGPEEATVLVTNVTEAREQVRSLQREQERLATVLGTTSAVLYAAALPGWEVEYLTESAAAVLGWSVDELRVTGFWREIVHPEDLPRLDAAMDELFARGVQVREFRQRHKDGRWIWLHDEIRLAYGQDGRPVRATGAFFDISARKADEVALRALNATLERRSRQQRLLVELSSELGRASAREAMLEHVGRSLRGLLPARVCFAELEGPASYRAHLLDGPEEPPGPALPLAGTSIAEALALGGPVTTLQHPLEAFGDWRAAAGGQGLRVFATVPLLRPTGPLGALRLAFDDARALEDEELGWIEQVAALLTAQLARLEAERARDALLTTLERRVEERTHQLRASEERFAELFLRAPQGLLIVDGAGTIVQANESAAVMFGYGALTGVTIAALLAPELRARHGELMEAFGAGQAGAEAMRSRTVPAVRRDGRSIWVEVKLVPVQRDGARQVLVGLVEVTERVHAAEAVARSLAEKETLLREIHHRVKNNLQVISGLLSLQGDHVPSPEAQAKLTESVYRVRSMALVHEQLYGVDSLARIDLGEYSRTLTAALGQAMAPDARLDVQAERLEVPLDVAMPFGLLLNELVTNALKYGVPSGSRGPGPDVRVELSTGAEGSTLVVSDRGPGLPAGFDPKRSKSLGLQLVKMLSRQLRGTLQFGSGPGARMSVAWPHPASAEPAV